MNYNFKACKVTELNKITVVIFLLAVTVFIGGWGPFTKKLPEATGRDVSTVEEEIVAIKKEYVIQEEYEYSDTVSRGCVTRLDPESGTRVKKGSVITVYISRGKPITVSDYRNSNIDSVKVMLSNQGINFDCSEEYSEKVAKNCVISSDPESGVIVEEGTTINLVVSLGSEYRSFPEYSEMSGEELVSACEDLSLKYNLKEDFSSEFEKGDIISCSKNPKDRVSVEKDVVEIVISKGEGITVPDLTGKNADNAKSALENLGLSCMTKEEYSDKAKGTVISSSVSAGTLVDEGSEITIVISKGTVEQEFKDACETPTYDELIRNPNKYESIKIKVKVKVTKVENETLLGIKYGETIWGTYQGEKIVITDNRDVQEPTLRAGDTVTIYGYGNGTSTVNVKQKEYQGSAVFGFSYNKTVDSYDIPNISAKYITF